MTEITLTANAGLLLETGGFRFLIDALHHEGNYPFSKVPLSLLHRMIQGEPPYGNADFLLFTHAHPDHYSPSAVLPYLQHNRVRRLFLPTLAADEFAREAELLAWLKSHPVPFWRLGLEPGKTHTYLLCPHVYLIVAGMQHTSQMFAHLTCDCLLLSVYGKQFLFTSDCSYDDRKAYAFLKDIPLDAAFVNPYFFHTPEGQALLREDLRPKNIVVYHIPFQGEDPLSLRRLVRRDAQSYDNSVSQLFCLTQAEQHLNLE